MKWNEEDIGNEEGGEEWGEGQGAKVKRGKKTLCQ